MSPGDIALAEYEQACIRLRCLWSDATMTIHDRIQINPKIMLGKLVIRGTRIPVELIVRKLSESADEKALLEAYPRLVPADIHAGTSLCRRLPRT